MIGKELWEARWQIFIGAVVFLAILALAPQSYNLAMTATEPEYNCVTLDGGPNGDASCPPVPEEFQAPPVPSPAEVSARAAQAAYNIGGVILVAMAGIMGVGMISDEARGGTIQLLLSKPVSRARLLLAKHLASALSLLALSVAGSIVLFVSLWAKGYPMEELSAAGFVLSALLFWLGSLFVMGIAAFVSVAIKNSVVGLAVVGTLSYLLLAVGSWLSVATFELRMALGGTGPMSTSDIVSQPLQRKLNLITYWTSESLYQGEGLAAANFLVCLIAAVIPLLAALYLFQRKAY